MENENAMQCKLCIYKQMLGLNRKNIKCISKKHYLLAYYIVTFRNSRSTRAWLWSSQCRNIPRDSVQSTALVFSNDTVLGVFKKFA